MIRVKRGSIKGTVCVIQWIQNEENLFRSYFKYDTYNKLYKKEMYKKRNEISSRGRAIVYNVLNFAWKYSSHLSIYL